MRGAGVGSRAYNESRFFNYYEELKPARIRAYAMIDKTVLS
jgi:hypothetical protein